MHLMHVYDDLPQGESLAERAAIITQHHIDWPSNDGAIDDPGRFQKAIERIPADVGHVVLDWEGKWIEKLQGRTHFTNAGRERHQKEAIEAGLELIALTKKVRPDLKVSFYAIPYIYPGFLDCSKKLPNSHQTLCQNVASLAPLMDACDFLTGVAYLSAGWQDRDYSGLEFILTSAREIAPSKPLYFMVFGRYLSNCQIVHPEVIAERTAWMHRSGVDGLILWGAEDYFIRQAEKAPGRHDHTVYSSEMGGDFSRVAQYSKSIEHYHINVQYRAIGAARSD